MCADAPVEEGCYECLGCLCCYGVVEVLGKGGLAEWMEEKREGGSVPPSEIELLHCSLLAPIL